MTTEKKDEQRVRKFWQSLHEDERNLVRERDFLYQGSWERLRADLRARAEKRPYIFKHARNLEDDLPRIEKLESYEKKNNVNLADFDTA